MTLMEAGEALAEMCYTHVYPLNHEDTVEIVAHDFEVEINLIRNEPDYIDNLSEEAKQFNINVADKWNAASEFDRKVVIKKLLEIGVVPQKDE